jgi:hypothetical protein
MGFDFADTREFLGQQPPRASGRTHATTATTLAAAGVTSRHHDFDTREGVGRCQWYFWIVVFKISMRPIAKAAD